jgi:2,5-furandicarboxylate decarboxylase 2
MAALEKSGAETTERARSQEAPDRRDDRRDRLDLRPAHPRDAARRRGGWETHFIVSDAGVLNAWQEHKLARKDIQKLADVVHNVRDVGASIASGSFITAGMVIAPCSMKTLAGVAHAYADNLITRAADVVLKERRRLVLITREAPLNLAHIRNMEAVTLMGGVIFPPVPAFYSGGKTIDDLVNHTVGRVLDLFGVEHETIKRRWQGMQARHGQGESENEVVGPHRHLIRFTRRPSGSSSTGCAPAEANEMIDVKQPVDIRHIATLVDQSDKALYFHNVIGYDMPVVSGIIRTSERAIMGDGLRQLSRDRGGCSRASTIRSRRATSKPRRARKVIRTATTSTSSAARSRCPRSTTAGR